MFSNDSLRSEIRSRMLAESDTRRLTIPADTLKYMVDDTVKRIHEYGWAEPDKEAIRAETSWTIDMYAEGRYNDIPKEKDPDLDFDSPNAETIAEDIADEIRDISIRKNLDISEDTIGKMAKLGAENLINDGWVDPDLEAVRDEAKYQVEKCENAGRTSDDEPEL